jgi:dTDP-4-dehydrorhamnose 3,5-epimerase
MEFIKTAIEGLYLIQPKVFGDDRGYFFESFNQQEFLDHGINVRFLQDNESMSRKNVLRGLHYQLPPYEQGKLVRVGRGVVRDFAVDLRKNSPTFRHVVSAELSAVNKTMFWIPPGFAHGFVTLEDDTVFLYKCTNIYNPAAEQTIIWNDPEMDVDWGIPDPIVSERDSKAPRFKDVINPF